MPTTISGAPTHVLIVHLVAVLLPVSILAALILVAVPIARKAFAVLTVVVAFVACLAIPLAFSSGGALRGRVAPTPLVTAHVARAHQLAVVAAAFGICLATFVAVDLVRRFRHEDVNRVEAAVLVRLPAVRDYSRRHRLLSAHRGAAALVVVTAVLSLVAVVRTGDSGARAAWQGRLSPVGASRR